MTETTESSIADRVKNRLPESTVLYEMAELFKVFGDATRAGILSCLSIEEMCVGDLAVAMEMSVSAVSHQLRILRNARLVKGVKAGKEVKYSLDDKHVSMILECGLHHLSDPECVGSHAVTR